MTRADLLVRLPILLLLACERPLMGSVLCSMDNPAGQGQVSVEMETFLPLPKRIDTPLPLPKRPTRQTSARQTSEVQTQTEEEKGSRMRFDQKSIWSLIFVITFCFVVFVIIGVLLMYGWAPGIADQGARSARHREPAAKLPVFTEEMCLQNLIHRLDAKAFTEEVLSAKRGELATVQVIATCASKCSMTPEKCLEKFFERVKISLDAPQLSYIDGIFSQFFGKFTSQDLESYFRERYHPVVKDAAGKAWIFDPTPSPVILEAVVTKKLIPLLKELTAKMVHGDPEEVFRSYGPTQTPPRFSLFQSPKLTILPDGDFRSLLQGLQALYPQYKDRHRNVDSGDAERLRGPVYNLVGKFMDWNKGMNVEV